jgi:hypothetical protein
VLQVILFYLGDDILGEASTDGIAKGAIAYSLGGNGGYTIQKELEKEYKSAQITDHVLKTTELPPPGPQELPDEIPSETDYYDGSLHLNAIKVQCKIFSNPTDCLHQSSCGWCGSSGQCILGNNLGPLERCKNSTYVFTAPFPNWSPETKVITENTGGVKLTVASK